MFSFVSAVFPGENSTQTPEHLSSLGSNSSLDPAIALIRRSTASPDAGIALIDRQAAGRYCKTASTGPSGRVVATPLQVTPRLDSTCSSQVPGGSQVRISLP